jgi:hypothetical protein
VETVHDISASDYVLHGPITDPELCGREGVQQFVNASREALHEVDITVEDQIVEGDKVVTRWKARRELSFAEGSWSVYFCIALDNRP